MQRVLRDSLLVQDLKIRYAFRCQLFGTRLELRSGYYCEAHHLKPLGRPHHGPDLTENLIVVCPNHHVLLDYAVMELSCENFLDLRHRIDPTFLDYHNQLCRK